MLYLIFILRHLILCTVESQQVSMGEEGKRGTKKGGKKDPGSLTARDPKFRKNMNLPAQTSV